jgi:hypothetical protein
MLDHIQQSIEAFEDMMAIVQDGVEAQSAIIEEQRLKIEELEEWPIKTMIVTIILGYIYGAFFGVWVCPK